MPGLITLSQSAFGHGTDACLWLLSWSQTGCMSGVQLIYPMVRLFYPFNLLVGNGKPTNPSALEQSASRKVPLQQSIFFLFDLSCECDV